MSEDAAWREFQRRSALVDAQIGQADQLEAARQVEAALTAYRACFDIAQREAIPLYIHQLTHIWMGIGFCYADHQQWDQALQFYQQVEKVLKAAEAIQQDPQSPAAQEQVREWTHWLPPGVQVIMPEGFEPAEGLAYLYESMGLAYDNSDRFSTAQTFYQQAIEGHQQRNDMTSAARVWEHVAVHRQRREDWENLQVAAEQLLALAEKSQDVNRQIRALQFLAQASWNQLRMLAALEYLKRVVELEQQGQHPDLSHDEQMLANFRRLLGELLQKRLAQAQPVRAKVLPDPARFQPLAELCTGITVQKSVERGAPQLLFVIQTRKFDLALQALQLFHLTLLPLNVQFMRQISGPDNKMFPQEADFWIEWALSDLTSTSLWRTVLRPAERDAWAALNAQSPRFMIVLEEEKRGLFGKPRREAVPGLYEPYRLDWQGIEGVATYLRSSWREVNPARIQAVLELLQQRLDEHGPAAGLLTQMGFLYRVVGQLDQAEKCYLEEIRLGLRADGLPGPGAWTALCNLGTVYKKQQALERARLSYRLALLMNPNYFEVLLSLPGILEPLDHQLLCLGRAWRLRPTDPLLKAAVRNLCTEYPHAVDETARLIREIGQAMDLSRPLEYLAVPNPAAAVQELLAAPTAVGLGAAPAGGPAGPLTALEQVMQVLAQFAAVHAGSVSPTLKGATWQVTLEELEELKKDLQGKVSVEKTPGAVLQLEREPELIVRVVLNLPQCKVQVLQETRLPNVPQPALKSVAAETIAARAETLFALLNQWVEEGVLYQTGGRWYARL